MTLDLNTCYLGDCLDIMRDIPDGSIDMILCDLPYGVTHNKWDSIIDLDKLWKEYNRISKNTTPIILTAQNKFNHILAMSNIEQFRYEWIWEKTNGGGHLNSHRMPMAYHENVLVFYKKLPVYNPQFVTGEPYTRIGGGKVGSDNYGKTVPFDSYNNGIRYPSSIIKISNPNHNLLHPTQKPVPLFEYLIKTYTNEGDLVLDNCMGSGTTAVACINTRRNFICIEKEQRYFDIAQNRIKELRAQGKLEAWF